MKKGNKWILALAAAVMLAVTWLDNDLSALETLSPSDWLPVLLIAGVIFLVKTGLLSAILLGLKKLWEKLHKK